MLRVSHPRQRRWPRPLVVAGLALALLGGLGLCGALQMLGPVSSVWQRARAVQAAVRDDDLGLSDPASLAWLRDQAAAAHQDLVTLRAQARPLLAVAPYLGWLPGVGPDLAASPALVDLAVALCDAGQWGLAAAEPVAQVLSAPRQGTFVEAALPALERSRPHLAQAERALRQAQAARARLQGLPLSPRLQRLLARLDRYLPALQATVQLAGRAQELLGGQRPVAYLILAQNNHELRPTGGFISGVGILRLSQGRISELSFQDSYQVDARCDVRAHPPAPAPLREYLWAGALMFRDANWSPDYPTSAAVAASIYRLCQKAEVDGVIAIDLEGVALLLGALGPLRPPGYPAPVTRETLLQYVAQYWTDPLQSESIGEDLRQWWGHRKDFMGDLLRASLERLTGSPQSLDPRALAGSLVAAFEGRHLLVYLRDPASRSALAGAGWDGALAAAEGDYLMVVDANLGFRKVNPSIRQSLDYRVDLGAAPPQATLTVRYRNESRGEPECVAGSRYESSYAAMMQGCYWDYVRVYAPPGSRLLDVVGSDRPPEAGEEAGKAVFAALLVVAPGEERQLTFRYELPEQVSAGVYRLLVQKQAGTAALPVTVGLVGPGWRLGGGSDAEARFALAADTRLVAARAPGGLPWGALAAGGVLLVAVGLGLVWAGRRG